MVEDNLIDIDETTKKCHSGCKTTEYKEIDVTVPITIEPYACIGDACVEIIDEPSIIPVPRCMRKYNCQYAIKQKLCVIFPIEFNAVASSGDPICSPGDNCDCRDCDNCCYDKCHEDCNYKCHYNCNDKCHNNCNNYNDDCNNDFHKQEKDRFKEKAY